jgi:hypothetical protein
MASILSALNQWQEQDWRRLSGEHAESVGFWADHLSVRFLLTLFRFRNAPEETNKLLHPKWH